MVLGALTYRALQRVDPVALEQVIALLGKHPHYGDLLDAQDDRQLDAETRRIALFMRATRWADDVRPEPYDEYSRPNWHYVNFRWRVPDELSPPRGPRQDGYLLWALEENLRRLDSDSETVRAIALTWMFHLVTDAHQPLHNIAMIDSLRPDGDRGGNLSFVRVAEGASSVNMHWLWDGLINRSDEVADALERAREIEAQHGEALQPRSGEAATAFTLWSEQGARTAIEHAYLHGDLPMGTDGDGTVLPGGYMRDATMIARERGAVAAARLAGLLAEIF
jgi:hypothetical protein